MIDKLVLIDSCLHSFDGHQYNYVKSIIELASARGIRSFTLSNASTTDQVSSSISAIPAFNFLGVELISDFSENPSINYNYNFVHFNLRFLIGLANASHRLPSLDGNTRVFFTTANFRHILGILGWLDLFPEASRPRPVVMLRDRDHLADRSTPLHRLVLPILASPRFSARFCTESQSMVDHYSALSGTSVDLVPVPIDGRRYRDLTPQAANRPVTIGFFGQARLSKGFQLLPQVVERILATTGARLQIQAQIGEFDADHDAPIAAALGRLRALAGTRLELVEGSIPYEEYLNRLFSADIILLPYDPQIYQDSASAVLVEALAAGKVVIVPARTWMAREASRAGAGVLTFETHGPEPIASAIAEAVMRIDELRAASDRTRATWIEAHDVSRIVDYLCAAPAPPA
jgi:glycosyltransferase involved in cell wall biosynthesis